MEVRLLSSAEAGAQTWRCDAPILVMPFTDAAQAQRAAVLMCKRAGADGLLLAVHDDSREGFIRIANRVFAASDSPYFGYVAQDAFPGRYWLRLAVQVFRDESVHLVAFNDGKWFGALAAYGLARREWASRNYGGPLFHPSYRRHYADTELSLFAAEAGGLGYSPHSVLMEADWDKDIQPIDGKDQKTFRERAASGFDDRVRSKELLQRFG